jgi:hypothetical protein
MTWAQPYWRLLLAATHYSITARDGRPVKA